MIERQRIEAALLAFFFSELEGTMEEFYASLVSVTPRQRTQFERGVRRLVGKETLEAIGYIGRWMNYRVSETALAERAHHQHKEESQLWNRRTPCS